ncbi:FAD-dependent oxidoreductase [Owenweeksia hongkongensis]|uniref:FAD-dependent oxidoreductase n=1 Tax=Owenweeksia hongkongensis TaxID=253245 RepID=UPI003A95A67A
MENKKVTIAGAGLVGSLLACYMAKKGHDVKVYERRPDMRKTTIDGGRSINLALSNRGWKSLEGVGVADEVRKMAIPMYGRVMHSREGELTNQPYGLNGEAIYSVSRGGLNALLMDEAEKHSNVSIDFDQQCMRVNLETAEASFKSYSTKEITKVEGDLLFGTDGAFSAVRSSMVKTDRFNYSQQYIEHGYKELSIPANADGTHKMEKEALHIWPRGSYMLIALPNPDGSFTCTLFFANEGETSFETVNTLEKARAFFKEHFADALELMANFDEEWENNPVSSLVIIRCFPWSKNGKVALLGDASHAIVPFYGQGMNSGFEDCTILEEIMSQHGDDWNTILKEFETQRKPDADAIADLAMRNFVEMRDLTGNADFLLRKKIEAKFSRNNPGKWMPLYSMVTFSDIRYSDALKEGQRQDRIMEEVMAMPDIHQNWEDPKVEAKILELLGKY